MFDELAGTRFLSFARPGGTGERAGEQQGYDE